MNRNACRAMNGTKDSPPKDGTGNPISQLTGWEQAIKVNPVDPARLSLDVIDSDPTAIRVTVTVTHNDTRITTASWIRFK